MRIEKEIKRSRVIILGKTILITLSPLLSIPSILIGIYKKEKYNLFLLAGILGLMQYIYVGSQENDLFEHYKAFDIIRSGNWTSYLYYIERYPDNIFYFLMFVYSKMGLSAQLLWASINTFIFGVFFNFFYKSAYKKNLSKPIFFTVFLLVLFSFNFPQLFSSIRFYFGLSFIVLAFHYGIVFKNKRLLGVLFLVLAGFTHFSTFVFAPLYFLLWFKKSNLNLLRLLFFISFIFLLIPREIVPNLISSIGLFDNFQLKIKGYSSGGDLVSNAMQSSTGGFYVYLIKQYLWLYFGYIYLIVTRKRNSTIRAITLGLVVIVNIFYQFPFTSFRYSLLLAFFLSIDIIQYSIEYRKNTFLKFFLVLFFVATIVNIVITRDNLLMSYANLKLTNLYSIFSTHIGINDFR